MICWRRDNFFNDPLDLIVENSVESRLRAYNLKRLCVEAHEVCDDWLILEDGMTRPDIHLSLKLAHSDISEQHWHSASSSVSETEIEKEVTQAERVL
jgi:hypothetical protein